MKHYIGLDVSLKTTAICIMAENGKITHEMATDTEPQAIAFAIFETELEIEAVGIEAGGTSRWLVKELQELNLPAFCIDSRRMAAAIAINTNKTDRNDAREIANALRANYFKEVHQKSDESAGTSTFLNIRRNLVNQRTSTVNCIRGSLRGYGKFALGSSSSSKKFVENVKAAMQELNEETLRGIIALISTYSRLCQSIDELDAHVEKIAKEDKVVQLLTSINGVGPLTALTYKAVISDPSRFVRSRAVGAYVGMTPRQYSSGETEIRKGISKAGSKELRALLSDAAMSIMYNCKSWSRLKVFGLKIKRKHGHKKAIVALGRKLAVVMHRMWVENKPFEPGEVDKKQLEKLNKPSRKEKKTRKSLAAV